MVEQTPYRGRPGVNHHESGTGTPYNAKIQEMVYDIINSDIGNKYWVQRSGSARSLLLFYFGCVELIEKL